VFSVRLAEPADAMEVAGVHVRSWQHAYRGLFPDEYLDGLRPEDRAARYTFEGGADQPLTIVALEDGVIRGFAAIAAARGGTDGKTGELLALYVDPAHWGRGVGRRLTVEARDRLTDQGFESAVLWVLKGNDRAERFYRSDGWMPDGARREEEVWGVVADELRYQRTLR
jgi:ribosomal protein S18 acetylase RimI-like enzyme